jgi:hypothetical protein
MIRAQSADNLVRELAVISLMIALISFVTFALVDASPNIDFGDLNDSLLLGGKIVFLAGQNQTLRHGEISGVITIQRQCLNGTALIHGENTLYLEARATENMTHKSATAKFYDASCLPLPTSDRGTELVIQNGSSTANFYFSEATPGTWAIMVLGSDGLSPIKPEVLFSMNMQYKVSADGSMQPYYEVGYFLSSIRTCFAVNSEPMPTSMMVPLSTVLMPKAVVNQPGDTPLSGEEGILFGVVFAVCVFIVIAAAAVVVLFGQKR